VCFYPLGESDITWQVAKNAGETLRVILISIGRSSTLGLAQKMNAVQSSRRAVKTLVSAQYASERRCIACSVDASIQTAKSASGMAVMNELREINQAQEGAAKALSRRPAI